MNIFGFESCNSGILLSREIWYCIWWLDLSRDFLEYSKQSQDLSWLIFGPGIFLGVLIFAPIRSSPSLDIRGTPPGEKCYSL